MKQYENKLIKQGYQFIAGLDEVGRGCIAGPIVVACVILPTDYVNNQIKDSKQIKPHLKRKQISDQIIKDCISYHIEFIDAKTVDQINPKQASRLGMQKCIDNIKQTPDYLLIDYEKIDSSIPSLSLTKGDQVSQSIAAASIIAKVARDQYMFEQDKKHPQYGFKTHVGYGTKKHLAAIEKYGIINHLHRKSCSPVKKVLK